MKLQNILRKKYNEECSFTLNCINIGLNDKEISELFLMYSNEINDELQNKNNIIEKTQNLLPKLKDVYEKVIEKIIDAYIICYYQSKSKEDE